MGILRGRVDLAYRASSDTLKMHRALRIVKSNTDISSDYTCVVSTFMEEDSRTKQMIVFGPISTTPEMPTAADMQLAAAIGSKGITLNIYAPGEIPSVPAIRLVMLSKVVS
ncbi:unnamed protein product [Parnassius apollo]|uniref:(apollo) hypothetical protein n=1 Tax=Parnassius apollo TaxID=110799 RepID=A0A8S3X7P7_PARAO|nr:unnamed protein product [Parnassius apollo]